VRPVRRRHLQKTLKDISWFFVSYLDASWRLCFGRQFRGRRMQRLLNDGSYGISFHNRRDCGGREHACPRSELTDLPMQEPQRHDQ
jgi:hypothetical protein